MQKRNEKGFVLITSLVLLSILTLLGITSQYKTVVQIKVSQMMQDGERAEAAANAGLVQQFWAWSKDSAGVVEFASLVGYVGSGGVVPASPDGAAIYHGDKTPSSVGSVLTPTDANITAANGYKIYTLQAGGLASNIAWGASTKDEPQVAVWATTYTGANTVYPYDANDIHNLVTSGGCSGCRLVVYALGRSGDARRMVRETQSVIRQGLAGVSAMTNAPSGDNFEEICNGGNPNRTGTANAITWQAGNGSTIIEVTQAPYLNGAVPSGTALASNTEIGSGGKGFRGAYSSKTGTTFDTTPLLLYSGHDTYSNVRLDYADVALDATGVQMPPNLLPTKLVNAPLLDGYGEVKYFSDPNEQLFEMDAYRWAAEQFVCQTPINPYPVGPPYYIDGASGNGKYCTKADALRRAVGTVMGIEAYAPVTGRLTIAQFEYNVANGIPMFGLIRLMFPAELDTGSGTPTFTCAGAMPTLHVIVGKATTNTVAVDMYAGVGWDFQKFMANDANSDRVYTGYMPMPAGQGYAYAPSGDNVNPNAEPDNDGDLGPNARIIVYGSFLIDYFADYDIEGTGTAGLAYNSVFDPAGGERILGILESPDVYLAIETNILLNPSLPRFTGDPLPFPTAADAPNTYMLGDNLASAAQMNMVDVSDGADNAGGNRVNLASPYDGYFPWSEGLVDVAGEGNVGTMRLMSRATTADNPGNESLVKSMTAGASIAVPTQGMLDLLALAKPTRAGGTAGTEAEILKYYYKLMKETANQNRANDWPIANWPTNNFSENFCIGAEDCGGSTVAVPIADHEGDKVHLMFPSGNAHGWKVALAALDMKAADWNTILEGIATPSINANNSLWEQIQNSCDGTLCRLGRPFSVKDAGLYKAVELEANQDRYFYVTEDATTGYGLMDADWMDIPAQMYSGGLLDMHAHSNMNGIIYTPGPLEWEPGNSDYDGGGGGGTFSYKGHLSYVTGSIITGYGAFTKNQAADDRYILAFDPQVVDNIATSSSVVVLRRYDWQLLQ